MIASSLNGHDSPFIGFSLDRLTASNRRTVGLNEIVWGLGGRNAPQVDGCGSAKSPASGEPTIRFNGVSWLNANRRTTGQRDATGERSVSLAEMVLYYTAHILQLAINRIPAPLFVLRYVIARGKI